uniref:C2H2-type domain-containing protein n=1 Tax=Heliothis virescens TaxID=7102 RepID=A0A2A4J941_HELVI
MRFRDSVPLIFFFDIATIDITSFDYPYHSPLFQGCSIAKHNTLENGSNAFDDLNSDTSVDNTLNDLNLYENKSNLLTQLHTEIKLESDDERSIFNDDMKIECNENVIKRDISIPDINESLDTNNLDLELKNSKETDNRCGRKKVEVFSCKKCKKTYKQKLRYQKHIEECKVANTKHTKKLDVDNEYAYNCGRNYNCENNSKIKQESNNGDSLTEICESQTKGQHLCGLCRLSFSNSDDLYQHLNKHWSSNCLACGLCDYVGIDLAAIAAHRYFHYPRTDDMRFKCHICGYKNVSLLALHFHYRSKHLKKFGGYCSRCNQDFSTLRMWKKHEQKHSPRYICDFCGKTFFSKYFLMEHIMTHMRLFKSICHICGNNFARKNYLKVHMKAVHTTVGPLKCSHCDKMFKNEIVLKKHLRNIKKEKIFKCTLCNKEYIMANQLKEHMIWHSQERPFCCEICGVRYKANSQLTVHMRKHTGLFPYKCTQCTKAFACSSQLKIHSSVHTGVRRHRCVVPNCERTFHSRKLMLAHLALRHKDYKREDGISSRLGLEN